MNVRIHTIDGFPVHESERQNRAGKKGRLLLPATASHANYVPMNRTKQHCTGVSQGNE